MKKIYLAIFVGILTLSPLASVRAIEGYDYAVSDPIRAFRKVKDIPSSGFGVPTVVEMPFSGGSLERPIFMLVSTLTSRPEALYYKYEFANKASLSAQVNTAYGGGGSLVDGDSHTSTSFPVSDDPESNVAVMTLKSATPITSSRFFLALDTNVALPSRIEVRAGNSAPMDIVVAQKKLESPSVSFLKTTATQWQITLWYSQPLRITELQLDQENLRATQGASVRFLAQPGASYKLYFDADRNVQVPYVESGDLISDRGVIKIAEAPTSQNTAYIIADGDRDSVPDLYDNCISLANTDQVDVNANGLGDVCDDFDRDGIINSRDNCMNAPNRDQADLDGDRNGDVCDDDESRITEKYSWLPWAGMGTAALVLIILFAITARSLRRPTDVV